MKMAWFGNSPPVRRSATGRIRSGVADQVVLAVAVRPVLSLSAGAGNRGKGELPLYYRADLDGAAHAGRRDAGS